jgi:hypothetical protein
MFQPLHSIRLIVAAALLLAFSQAQASGCSGHRLQLQERGTKQDCKLVHDIPHLMESIGVLDRCRGQ